MGAVTIALLKEASETIAGVITRHAQAAMDEIQEAKAQALKRIGEMAPNPNEFTFRAAAQYLRISERTMHERVKAGEIAYRKDGRKYLFTRTALEEYKAKNERPAV